MDHIGEAETPEEVLLFIKERYATLDHFEKFEKAYNELVSILNEDLALDTLVQIDYNRGYAILKAAEGDELRTIRSAELVFRISQDLNPGFVLELSEADKIVACYPRDPKSPLIANAMVQ